MMSLLFSEVTLCRKDGEETVLYESGHPDEYDMRELLKYEDRYSSLRAAGLAGMTVQVRHLRFLGGSSKEQLAEQAGVSRQAVSKWELDESAPELEKVVLLSEYFGVTTDYLLKGGGGKHSRRTGGADRAALRASRASRSFSCVWCGIYWKMQSVPAKKEGRSRSSGKRDGYVFRMTGSGWQPGNWKRYWNLFTGLTRRGAESGAEPDWGWPSVRRSYICTGERSG